MSAVVERKPQAVQERQPVSDASALMKIIDRAASDPQFDVAKLEHLLKVRDQWEAAEARKAFKQAFSDFKAEAVEIIKNKPVTDGPLKGKRYAELFSVVNAVTPALSKHGLSHSWRLTKDEKDWIEVTCTLTHVLGHSEFVSMAGPPDAGGAKNAIQARASTVTYLERYTLKAVCGLAEQGEDNDGGSDAPKLATDEFNRHKKAIEATLTKADAKAKWQDGVKACQAVGDLDAAEDLKKIMLAHAEFIDKSAKAQ